MAHFETFRTEEELLERIEQLRKEGFSDSELEVISHDQYDNPEFKYLDINDRERRADLQPEYSGIFGYYTGDVTDPAIFNGFGYDNTLSEEALGAVENGYYVLSINRDNLDDSYYDNSYEQRKNFIDEDIANRDDLNAREKIRLHEERLRVNKQRVKTGEVGLSKEVVTETQEVEVPVEKERVTIERHKVDQAADDNFSFDNTEDEIVIPVHEEEVTVNKDNVVTEEVEVKKDKVEETQRVSEQVRKEELHVNKTGDVREVNDGLNTDTVERTNTDTVERKNNEQVVKEETEEKEEGGFLDNLFGKKDK